MAKRVPERKSGHTQKWPDKTNIRRFGSPRHPRESVAFSSEFPHGDRFSLVISLMPKQKIKAAKFSAGLCQDCVAGFTGTIRKSGTGLQCTQRQQMRLDVHFLKCLQSSQSFAGRFCPEAVIYYKCHEIMPPGSSQPGERQ
ncbi:hypothetical protein AA21952_0816 [Acetobacter oeni LMG 21952]|nr:hypothetical protein AA21952_0816 [Acetobacter oeni LMG 21952]